MTPVDDQHVWVRFRLWWHLCFGVMASAALLLLAVDDAPLNRRLLAAGCVFALVCWYALLGAHQISGRHTGRDLLAAVGTVTLVWAGYAADPAVAVLLFIVYPQLFAYLDELRHALPAVAALSAGIALIDAARSGWTVVGSLGALGVGAVSVLFAVFFGVWITRIIEQSRDRAGLIEQLTATRAELAVAEHEAGVAAERQRLSLEIHDTLAQGFTSVVMLGQAAQTEVGRCDEEVRRYLGLIERTARENLAEARSLVTELAPSSLQAAPLPEALTRLTERFTDETGVAAQFLVAGPPRPLAGSAEVVLLRSAQEALNNVRRHAGATSVAVRLSYLEGGVGVQVEDDGCGFEPAAAQGFGLRGMRARVEQAGGDVIVSSRPGLGTSVGVVLR